MSLERLVLFLSFAFKLTQKEGGHGSRSPYYLGVIANRCPDCRTTLASRHTAQQHVKQAWKWGHCRIDRSYPEYKCEIDKKAARGNKQASSEVICALCDFEGSLSELGALRTTFVVVIPAAFVNNRPRRCRRCFRRPPPPRWTTRWTTHEKMGARSSGEQLPAATKRRGEATKEKKATNLGKMPDIKELTVVLLKAQLRGRTKASRHRRGPCRNLHRTRRRKLFNNSD